MGYRDDRDALRQRIAELETELSSAKGTIRRMQGKDEGYETEQGYSAFAGSPRGYRYEQQIDIALSESSFAQIAELLEERLPGGTVTRTGRVLHYKRLNEEVTVSPSGDGTSIVGNAYLEGRGAAFMFVGTLITIFVGAGLAVPASILGLSAPWIVGAIATGMLTAYGTVRGFLSRGYRESRKRLSGAVETIEQIAHEQTDPPLRIAIEDDGAEVGAEVEEQAALEAQAAEEAEDAAAEAPRATV